MRAIPAGPVPPIISMPMVMSPMNTGNGTRRRSYGSAATTANSPADDCTPKRTLSKGLIKRDHSCEREQHYEQRKLPHL
jgi:hypothetical protein